MLKEIGDFQETINEEFAPPGEFYIDRREHVPLFSHIDSYRRDFFKILFIEKGFGILHIDNKTIEIRKNTLVLSTPDMIPEWESELNEQTGYLCTFTHNFILKDKGTQNDNNQLITGRKYFILRCGNEEAPVIKTIFDCIYSETQSDYVNKYDLIKNYIWIIIHKIIKGNDTEPAHIYNASERISRMFLNMLESSFFINSPNDTVNLKTPVAFAKQLSVHVNHLNRALKTYTGRTTTDLISARIMREAKSLLRYTNWSISEISNCLHFQHPSNFQAFFKKQTGLSPKEFRKEIITHI